MEEKLLITFDEEMSCGGLDSWANYAGDTSLKDWYVVYAKHRDSEVLTNANFEAFLRELGGESETVQVHSFNHWAVGWIERIFVNPEDTKAVEIAEKITKDLQNYPVIDEELFSEREYEYAEEVWNNCFTLAEKIELCKKYGLSIFAARCKYVPYEDTGMLQDYLITP